jgi:hydrogenase maturation factor HypF (carbamoyltransferase family)
MQALTARGFNPSLARTVPPNDGGIALGQLWAAVLAGAAGEPAGSAPCA